MNTSKSLVQEQAANRPCAYKVFALVADRLIMGSPSWQDKFTIDFSGLASQVRDPHPTLLFLTLKAQRLPIDVYFQWAQQQYGLTLINPEFFPVADPNLAYQYRDLFEWNGEIVPLAEWEGHLYVGCIEPHPTLQKNPNVRLVLAPPAELEKLWFKSSVEKTNTRKLRSTPNNLLNDLNATCDYVLDCMKQYFEKSIVFFIKESSLHHWKADFPSSSPPTPLPLNDRSIFSIVYKTKKPFHGPVADSSTNQLFFHQWNNSQAPEHITLAPILFHDGQLSGMLLGFGNRNIPVKQSLSFTETQAQAISKTIQNIAQNQSAKKAA